MGQLRPGSWLFFAVIVESRFENRGGRRKFQKLARRAGFRVFIGSGCQVCKGTERYTGFQFFPDSV